MLMSRHHIRCLPLLLATLHAPFAQGQDPGPWVDVPSEGSRPVAAAAGLPEPDQPHLVQSDPDRLRQALDVAVRSGRPFALPRPDGGYGEFVLEDSGVMPMQLAARFPELRSLRGQDTAGTQVRIDVSPRGLQAMVFDPAGGWQVAASAAGEPGIHASTRLPNRVAARTPFTCASDGPDADLPATSGDVPTVPRTQFGALRRTYRIAVAATGEYTAFHGGTVASGMAAIVQTINRVNQIYENDLNVRLTLVANNQLLVYTDLATDPYANFNGATMLAQNQSNTDLVIGSANYDLGHVLGTAAGGVAASASVCKPTTKARAATGIAAPTGDPFWVDYVAHEIGHQFGAAHTYNTLQSTCSSSRSASSAYEPGSGSTLMSYAGICGIDNLQPHVDSYFHAHSLAQIAGVMAGTGNCSTASNNPNALPTILSTSPNASIPAGTPFALTASASAASGAVLTYTWEQVDLGAAQFLTAPDNGASPLFRSLPPATSPTRVFPRWSSILDGGSSLGERLPTTDRMLHFRLGVRDNRAGNAGVATTDAVTTPLDVALAMVASAGPFTVTTPAASRPWLAGETRNVRWNVAGTAAPPISCSQVALSLSVDGGSTFAHALGLYPNSGSAAVSVPAALVPTSSARLRASCVGNVFFNVSPANFRTSTAADYLFASGLEDPAISD